MCEPSNRRQNTALSLGGVAMPTEDIVALMIPATWLVMLAIEAWIPARVWPAARLWRMRGVAFFAMVMAVNAVIPATLPASLTAWHLVNLSWLPLVLAVPVGYLAVSLANALMHRAFHRFDLLWRWFHQLHHAPQRLDMASAIMFTPQEVAINVVLFQVVTVFVLGLAPVAAALVGYVAFFYGLFQHFNIRTPVWLGYLIQRPESHGVHHRRGFHAYNYSDFPLWDMLLGTFRNPTQYLGQVGFEAAAQASTGRMLLGRDANESLYGRDNRGHSDPSNNPA